MLFFLIAMGMLADQAVPRAVAAPPPPVIIRTVPNAYIPDRSGEPRQGYVVDIEIRAGSTLLWSGPLRVLYGTSSSYRSDQNEPSPADCGASGYRPSVQNSLSVQLSAERDDPSATSRLTVSVRWARPGDVVCPGRQGARVVEVNEGVPLAQGQGATIKGDADLVIRLHRQ